MKDAAAPATGTRRPLVIHPDAIAATDKGRHKGDYSDDVQAGERRQRFFLADGFFAAGFLALDFLDLDGRPALSGGATTVLMTPRR